MKVIIVGGVAGGASCAARLRRLDELPRDKEINVFCRSGQRSYYATRILLQHGFKAKNVSGGMLSLAHNYMFDMKKGE